MTNRNDQFGLHEGDTYIGTDGHHHHFHEGLKEGDWYVGTDGHHHRYHDVAYVHRRFSFRKLLKNFKDTFTISTDDDFEDYADRHKGLKEGDLYIGSDGHHHHYHPNRRYYDSSQKYKEYNYHHHHRKKKLARLLFILLTFVAIIIVGYVAYIYSVE